MTITNKEVDKEARIDAETKSVEKDIVDLWERLGIEQEQVLDKRK